MSMILDALRKSEAERRRAEVPDLFDEAPAAVPARVAGPSRQWLWAVAAIVVMLGAAALIAARNTGAVAPDAVAIADSAPATPTPITQPPAAGAPASPLPATVTAPPPVSATTPSPSAVAEPLPAATVAPVPPPAPPMAVVPPVSPPIPPAVSPQAATSAPPPAPTLAAARPAALAVPPPPAASAATAAPTGTSSTAVFTSPTAPLRLSDLSIEERQQLPALKISMLMWNPASERRFAIVDGNRVAEGDRVGDTVVDSITEDGVVLGWQGRRLKVPIR